jgi:hypothetical protein
MNAIRASIFAGVVVLFCKVGVCQESSKATTLEILKSNGNYVLTVPVSRLVMTIPKGKLALKVNRAGGSADSPRYFYFEDKDSRLLISGWFESDQGFPGIKQFWTNETAEWKREGLPEARDVAFVQLGDWNAVLYGIDSTVGRNSHVRAHWVQAGTWIDIHLSLTADLHQKEIREELQSVLKTISVAERQSQ